MFPVGTLDKSASKSGNLQQTDNYIWNTADILGRGATALVYYARHKVNGDRCAVKVFNERTLRHQSRYREIESLRRLKHPNIVMLLALESEATSLGDVIVMEYCSGGSLHHMLEQPEYSHGLGESEFLLFLAHIASGMQYLRNMGYIHRDIKPGNIMRQIGEDGRSIYKLTDFGAARELQEDETFMSIYGTEEYLHPEMYRQAVLKQPGHQEFTSAVDIWSLAVTLYHVATGQLPFQPFGGRKNAKTMHIITSSKPKGCISGVQAQPDGPIEWDSRLPSVCPLSQPTKAMLTRMLAGCLETNPEEMWTFDKFYHTAVSFTSLVPLNIFFYQAYQSMVLYVNKTDNIINVQEKIAECMDIPSCDQLLLWRDDDILHRIDPSMTVENFPKAIINSTIYLLTKELLDPVPFKEPVLSNFPDISSVENLDADATAAKACAGLAHMMCTVVDQCQMQQTHLMSAEMSYRHYIMIKVSQTDILLPEMSLMIGETKKRLDLCQTAYQLLAQLLQTVIKQCDSEALKSDCVRLLENTISQLTTCFQEENLEQLHQKVRTRQQEIQIYVQMLRVKVAEQEAPCLQQTASCKRDDYCLHKAEHLKQKTVTVSTLMVKHKRYGRLHPHESFIHKCEKEKLQEYVTELWSLTKEHCIKNLEQCYQRAQKEIGNLTKHFVRTKKVDQNMKVVREGQQQLSTKLDETEKKCSSIVNKLISLITTHDAGFKEVGVVPKSHCERSLGEGAEAKPSFSSTSAIQTAYQGTRSNGPSFPKRPRTMMLDKLSQELESLQDDSEKLKELVKENSDFMKRFLMETSSLQIEGSLDSDHSKMQMETI